MESRFVPERYFRLDEAGALIPRLARMLDALRRTRDQAVLKKARIDLLWQRLERGERVLGTLGEEQRALDTLASRLATAAREFEATGCILRDLDAGLVDFPFRARGGVTVFLCWRLGEPEIAFWHGLDEGYAGRKPIAQLPLDEA
jgi:hypothetical protein